MTLIAATVDSREPSVIKALSFGVPTGVALLDAGDFLGICADGTAMIVERKAVRDLLASISDGRLLAQAAKLRETTPWCYVVVTGALVPDRHGQLLLDGQPSGWQWARVQGALCSVQELGVSVVYAVDETDYAATVCRLACRSHDVVRLAPRRTGAIVSPAEAIISSLPGIGETHAKALLAYCGTAAWALTYLCSYPSAGIAGIGDVTKQRVRYALGLRDNEDLHVLPRESSEKTEEVA